MTELPRFAELGEIAMRGLTVSDLDAFHDATDHDMRCVPIFEAGTLNDPEALP